MKPFCHHCNGTGRTEICFNGIWIRTNEPCPYCTESNDAYVKAFDEYMQSKMKPMQPIYLRYFAWHQIKHCWYERSRKEFEGIIDFFKFVGIRFLVIEFDLLHTKYIRSATIDKYEKETS